MRYVLLLVGFLPLLAYRLRRPSTRLRRPSGSDRALVPLFLFGIGGVLYGMLVVHPSSNALEVFLPMGLGLSSLLMVDVPTEEEVDRMFRWLGLVGAVYLLLAAVVNIGTIHSLLKYEQYKNALFAFATMGLAAAFFTKRRFRLGVLILLGLVNFVGYPSATSLVALVVMSLAIFVTRPAATSIRLYLVAAVAAVAAFFAIFNLSAVLNTLGTYFSSVGKENSTLGRLALWTTGIQDFKQSPIIGKVFSHGTVTLAQRLTGNHGYFHLPFHNDFIFFLAEGGIIGFGLLIAFIVATEMSLYRRYRGYLRAGLGARARLTRLYFVMFNTFMLAAAFNPTLESVSASATLFGLYGLVMSLGAAEDVPRRRTASGPNEGRARVRATFRRAPARATLADPGSLGL